MNSTSYNAELDPKRVAFEIVSAFRESLEQGESGIFDDIGNSNSNSNSNSNFSQVGFGGGIGGGGGGLGITTTLSLSVNVMKVGNTCLAKIVIFLLTLIFCYALHH